MSDELEAALRYGLKHAKPGSAVNLLALEVQRLRAELTSPAEVRDALDAYGPDPSRGDDQ